MLDLVLQRVENIERKLLHGNQMDKRFDNIDKELARNSRLESIEVHMAKLRESMNSLASDLKSFSEDMNARLKDPCFES